MAQNNATSGAVKHRNRPNVAWAHHPLNTEDAHIASEPELPGWLHCGHAVLMTCLNLSHELNLRSVGQYASVQPNIKDPAGSMIRIMKGQ
jgi:hypothetical protein